MTLAAAAISVGLGGRPVLAGVSCRLRPGSITGIIGPNGAGKSTLLRTLAGLVMPSSGAVTLDGRPLSAQTGLELARAIAFLPQERAVHWPLSVRTVAALGRIPHTSGPAGESPADRRIVAEAMAVMDVGGLADRPVSELSGGELARTLFARALAQQSRIILADEPTAGLDPAHAIELFRVLTRLAAEGRAIAVALHDLSLAARFCHDVVMLAGGRVAAAGSRAEAMTAERLGEVFGVRFGLGLLEGVPVVAALEGGAEAGLRDRS